MSAGSPARAAESIPLDLLFFNVGVEIGQLIFIVAVVGLIALGRRAARSLELAPPTRLWRVPTKSADSRASGSWSASRAPGVLPGRLPRPGPRAIVLAAASEIGPTAPRADPKVSVSARS